MSFFVLKYFMLAVCGAAWVYATYHGVRFEDQLGRTTRDPFRIEALNHPASLFRDDLHRLARKSRRKVFAALAVFFGMGIVLLALLLIFGGAGGVGSPFQYR